jgi:hypothetical protein
MLYFTHHEHTPAPIAPKYFAARTHYFVRIRVDSCDLSAEGGFVDKNSTRCDPPIRVHSRLKRIRIKTTQNTPGKSIRVLKSNL